MIIVETKDKLVMCQVLTNFYCIFKHVTFDLSRICIEGSSASYWRCQKYYLLYVCTWGALFWKSFINFVKFCCPHPCSTAMCMFCIPLLLPTGSYRITLCTSDLSELLVPSKNYVSCSSNFSSFVKCFCKLQIYKL